MDARETIHQGWLEFCTDTSSSKSWIKLSKKSWKRRYFVLYRFTEDPDKVILASYEKDENWHCVEPKSILNLYPRYRIAKLLNHKGRENVLEINNEQEQWYLYIDKPKIIDLWATQMQMQTKLSRAISGRIFSVSGAVNKQMQRIGAAQQRCLLHLTRWGITLALQESRSILAMWPLKTIRNYESSSQCQFSIEAGRRAPMGEGLFIFHTNIGQDDEMFSVVDAFVSATLHEKAELTPNKRPTTDEEILKIYDQLHRSAIGMNDEAKHNPHNQAIDTPGYAPLGGRMAMAQDSISIYKPPDYNHLFDDSGLRRDDSGVRRDDSPSSGCETPRGLSFSDNPNNYDQLDRKESWGSKSVGDYDHINQKKGANGAAYNAYDKMDRTQHGFANNTNQSNLSTGFAGYPLRDEPSVPFLDDNEKPFLGRSPLSKTPEDQKYVFRNSIYSPVKDNDDNSIDQSIVELSPSNTYETPLESVTMPEGLETSLFNTYETPLESVATPENLNNYPVRNDSTASESSVRSKQRVSSSFKDKSIQDIADHFLYQMPSSFSSSGFVNNETLPEQVEASNGQNDEGEMYQNSESIRDSVFSTADGT